MKMLTFLFIAVSTFFFTSAVHARTPDAGSINTKAVDKNHLWVVAPGTRLVAGDPNQNEFYIIGKSDASTNVPAINQKRTIVANKTDIARIKIAISETLSRASKKKTMSKINVAMKTKKHKVARVKPISKIKVALNKKHRKVKRVVLTENN